MQNFVQYLLEDDKLKHLTHVEDLALSGHRGFRQAWDIIKKTHDSLKGRQRVQMSAKYDGAPSLVFGKHPETGEHFVATKSAWNKNPKINRTHQEIRDNYPDKPGLRAKLHMALATTPHVLPKSGGIYQGDVMYTRPDIKRHGEKLSVQPNTINYQTDSSSPHGQKMKTARIGMVVHTAYDGKTLSDLKSRPITDLKDFQNHPHVHLISPAVAKTSEYTGRREGKVRMALLKSRELSQKIDYKALKGHDKHIPMYINDAVRQNKRPTAQGYYGFLMSRSRDKGDVKPEHFDSVKKNLPHFDKVFKTHQYLQLAKNNIIGALDPHNTHFQTSIMGKPAGHEGYVVDGKSKMVNRSRFSFANFVGGKFQK